jgi:hypothetical protein
VRPSSVDMAWMLLNGWVMSSLPVVPLAMSVVETPTDRLRLAVVAYLAQFKGLSRVHAESDLRSFLDWCRARGLDPLQAARPHLELYVRWMQEVRRLKPSTVSSGSRWWPGSTASA